MKKVLFKDAVRIFASCDVSRNDIQFTLPPRSLSEIFRTTILALCLLPPTISHSQTLDEAVTAQLEVFNNVVCGLLLEGDDPDLVLTGPLAGPTLCRRNPPAGSSSSSASGASAAATTTISNVAKKRLRKAREEDHDSIPTGGAAGADTTEQSYSKGSFFITAESEAFDRDETKYEDGYNSDILRSTLGADYRITSKSVAGLALELSQQYIDFNNGGDSNVNSYGFVAYGSYIPISELYVQAYGGYTSKEYKRSRFASFIEFDQFGGINTQATGSPKGDYKADQYSAGALLAYDFIFGKFTLGPRLGFDWIDTDFGTYGETGDSGLELTFHDDKITSLQSSASIDAMMALRAGSWVLIPQLGVNWKREYENDQREVQVSFLYDTRAKRFTYKTDSPDRDWLELNLGIVAIPGRHTQIFANYRTITEHDYFNSQAIAIGVRTSF